MDENAKSKNIVPRITPRTSKAAEYHERYFLAKASKVIAQINSQPLSVFVCGPVEKNELSKKKIDTINELRRLGYDANTGEELVSELNKIDRGSNRTANVYENIAAAQSDLIVIFCSSPGTIGETYEFISIPEIARKTLVFIDRRFREGYVRNGVLEMHKRVNGLLEEYEQEDIDSCRLLTKTVTWVRDCQSYKWLADHNICK